MFGIKNKTSKLWIHPKFGKADKQKMLPFLPLNIDLLVFQNQLGKPKFDRT